jgi:energy-coupling factor transporter ATP-binding protein EcfA2
MYLKRVVLRNIKCFSELELDFAPNSQPRKWTAILGDNGLGKSTLLQAIGAALAGPGAIRELLPVAEGWVRSGQPDDGVILNGPERAYLARYYPGPPPEQANLAGSRYRGKEDEALARLADMAARHSRLWLAVEFRGPDYIKEWLDRNGYQAGRFTTQDIALYLYSFPKQAGVVRRPDTIKQAGPVTLDGYRLTPDPVPAGRVAHLALHWRAETAVPADYKVALRVTDADGRVLVAIDRPPVDGFAPTSGWPPGQAVEDHYGLWLPADASPGRYPIQLKLYQESTWAEVLAATLGPLQVVKP